MGVRGERIPSSVLKLIYAGSEGGHIASKPDRVERIYRGKWMSNVHKEGISQSAMAKTVSKMAQKAA